MIWFLVATWVILIGLLLWGWHRVVARRRPKPILTATSAIYSQADKGKVVRYEHGEYGYTRPVVIRKVVSPTTIIIGPKPWWRRLRR
jgi:hypothetical protein